MSQKLKQAEILAEYTFLAGLRFPRRKTRRPLAVAMVGLVGSGKSTIARVVARKIGAAVIEGDAIRVALRKVARYEAARRIAEHAAIEAIQRGSNVVIDSDFADPAKQKALADAAKRLKARVVFLRVISPPDVAIGRIISEKHEAASNDFFGGASSQWRGDRKLTGAIVKLREMWRRTPHHYDWSCESGGVWKLKKLTQIFAPIDTSDPRRWRRDVRRIIRRLKR